MEIPPMPQRLQKRIFLFYIAAVINFLMAGAVLLFGRGVVPDDKLTWIMLFFLGFGALDLWMPAVMKKKWENDVRQYHEQQSAPKQ
ncbi:MAG: hypothetical protein FJY56_15015 [Betaproteobacteria bacterium]|nr:hypothetical protein [Betaproteobacteria bacterium]